MQPVQRRGDVRHPEVEQGTAVGQLRWNVPDQFEGDRAVQLRKADHAGRERAVGQVAEAVRRLAPGGQLSAQRRRRRSLDSAYWGRIIISMTLMAAGLALTSSPATDAIMGAVSPEKAGAGPAVNDMTRELGGTLGVAVVGSVMASVYGPHVLRSLTSLSAPPAAALAFLPARANAPRPGRTAVLADAPPRPPLPVSEPGWSVSVADDHPQR
jgi:hypothetical protein